MRRPASDRQRWSEGLAVTVRLATVHRATNDVDTVAEGAGPRDLALQYLGDRDAAEENRIEVDGVKVDVMETWPLPDNSGDLPDDDLDRLFVVGHRWALDSATPVAIDSVSPAGSVLEAGTLIVATMPALVACKLHAIADRKGPSLSKRESDALDLVRLTDDLVRSEESVQALRSSPFDLATLVAAQVERWFVDDALRTARLANAAAVPHGRIPVGQHREHGDHEAFPRWYRAHRSTLSMLERFSSMRLIRPHLRVRVLSVR